jgi:transposase
LIASQEEQRMQDDLTRLVGLEGFVAKRVVEVGDRLDLEVELVARAGVCLHCGRASLEVKERPWVRVRDLPVAGRRTDLVWRKRRFVCRPCGRTFTEQHPELPSRQRVTRRFRGRLLERVRGGMMALLFLGRGPSSKVRRALAQQLLIG